MESVWIFFIGGLLIYILTAINQLRDEIKSTNSTLESIAKQIGVPDKIIENIDDELKNLIKEGKKVKAVKRYREVTGLGLKESKEYVDSLEQ